MMKQSLSDKLTEQFYEWERRGRGWLLAPVPIELEPPHHPFFYFHSNDTYIDDGKRPTLFSRFTDLFKSEQPAKEVVEVPDYSSVELYTFEDTSELYALKLTFSKNLNIGILESEQLLLMLSYSTFPLSFEIIATHELITIQFVCREEDVEYVKSQIKVYFPQCAIKEDLITDEVFVRGLETMVIDFGLKEEFTRPILMLESFKLNPYTSLFGTLDRLQKGERVVIQILFSKTINNWSRTIIDSVTDYKGNSFFSDAPEMPSLAKEKVKSPIFGVTIRCTVQSSNETRVNQLFPNVVYSLINISRSNSNSLIPLLDKNYEFEDRLEDIQNRTSRRMGMLLNSKELLNFVHLPSKIESDKLFEEHKKTKTIIQADCNGIELGVNIHNGIEKKIKVTNAERLTHTHIIGATGTGKSTLLLSLIHQDIQKGNGFGVIDPHGDLIDAILSNVPLQRKNDVVIIDPSDAEYPIGLNVLHANSEVEKEVLSSDLVASFRKHATSWGDQMNSVLANAVLAFLESSKGGTLLDLRRFLLEKEFREELLESVSDSHIHYYWKKQFPILKTNSVGPILTRLDTFLRPKLIRNMVGQKRGLDFETLIDTQKIVLIKLSQGLIGEENSYLLGSFLVTKIHQAAMARQGKDLDSRKDFFLYIDEFQNFATPSMSSILSGARKYHLGLILAHQDMQQLQKADAELASSVLSNAGTRICFRLGDTDARTFEKGFSFFEAADLQRLSTGEAIARIGRADNDFSLKITPASYQNNESLKQEIIAFSRATYSSKVNLNEVIDTTTRGKINNPKEWVQAKNDIENIPAIPIVETPLPEIKEIGNAKEESQHRYLQVLIKKMAESKGYRATLEVLTTDGKGRVDVAIENEGVRIACEVSVTTDVNWEMHNIEKCFASGYDLVISCVADKKVKHVFTEKIKNTFPKHLQEKIKVCEPEELFSFLDMGNTEETKNTNTIKGYRVKVQYDSLSHNEMDRKKDLITKVMVDSLKRLKK